jgi:predicted nuclease with RNAse H fold
VELVEFRQHYGLDLKSSFSTGKSTLWHDSPSPRPFRFKKTAELLPFLRSSTQITPKTVAVDAPLTFAASDLFTDQERITDDISTLATVEGWRNVNCWTKRPWEKFVRKALGEDSLRNVLWEAKVRKNKQVARVPVINVQGYGGLDLSIRGLWLRRLLVGLGFRLTDTCCDDRLQLIEVHPALALALWWQDRRTSLFPNYKSDWRNSVVPLVAMLKEVDDRTPDTFANEDDLDCFVAWVIACFFHTDKTVTLGCVRDGFVIVPRTRLAVALAEKCCKGKVEMEKLPRRKKKAP